MRRPLGARPAAEAPHFLIIARPDRAGEGGRRRRPQRIGIADRPGPEGGHIGLDLRQAGGDPLAGRGARTIGHLLDRRIDAAGGERRRRRRLADQPAGLAAGLVGNRRHGDRVAFVERRLLRREGLDENLIGGGRRGRVLRGRGVAGREIQIGLVAPVDRVHRLEHGERDAGDGTVLVGRPPR